MWWVYSLFDSLKQLTITESRGETNSAPKRSNQVYITANQLSIP